jgi:Protein of unknown function (DUF3631)
MSSDDIVAFLEKLDDRPWSEFNRGKAITKAGLARLLEPFRILSTTFALMGTARLKAIIFPHLKMPSPATCPHKP